MESDSNMYGEYGERFWEDVMNTSSDFPDLAHTVEVSSASEGGDILQQSLRQAKILDATEESDPLDFNDFGFTDNNLLNNSTPYNDYKQLFNSNDSLSDGCRYNQNSNTKIAQESNQSLFDVSEFLNITTVATRTIASGAVKTSAVSSTTLPIANVTFTTYPNTVIHHQPSNLQPVSKSWSGNVISSPALNVAIPTNSGAFVVQLPPNNQVISQNSAPKFVVTHQSAQYVVGGVQRNQSFVNVPLSNAVQLPISVQSHPVAVCSSTYTTAIAHPISTPVIFSSKTSNQVITTPLTQVSSAQPHPVVNRIQAPVILQQKQVVPTHEEQTNKLALLLQSRAVNYPGVGKILKLSGQNINVTSIEVAKALASRILQQKLNQEKQNQVAILTSSTEAKTASHNVNVVSIPVCGLKNATVVSLPQQLHSQLPNSSLNQSVALSRVNVVPQAKSLPMQVKSTSPSITVSIKPTQVTQVTKRDSSTPSPQNRFQIASVNISRPSSQPNMSSTIAQQRINSPIAIASNLQQVSAAKVNPVRKAIPLQSLPNTSITSAPSTIIQYQGATIKLNLTAQQASSLTAEQLQKIVVQHQTALNARKAIPTAQQTTQSNGTLSDLIQAKSVQLPQQGVSLDKTKVMTFRVDPNLTSQQIDEVQQIILKKVPLNKVQQLSTEQKQLLSAFRAQLRTMEPGIQQYYLRNPHLFLQKVFQHIQSGKPFLFQVRVDPSNSSKSFAVPAISITSKGAFRGGNHPTITLSADGNRPRITKTSVVSAPAPVVSSTSILTSPKTILRVPTPLRAPLPQQAPAPLHVFAPLRAPTPLQVSAKRSTTSNAVTPKKMKRTANVVPDNSAMEALPAKRPSFNILKLDRPATVKGPTTVIESNSPYDNLPSSSSTELPGTVM